MSWGPIVWLKNQIETIINKNTKWYFSDIEGTQKTLIRNVEFIDKEIELTTSTADKKKAYIAGMFVPKVSGVHKIVLAPDSLNADDEGTMCIFTANEFYNAAIIYNQNTPDDMFSQFEDLNGALDTYIEDKGASLKSISRGANVMSTMKCVYFTDGNSITTYKYCTANEPVYFGFFNESSRDVTLWSNVVSVYYNLTEPYEY